MVDKQNPILRLFQERGLSLDPAEDLRSQLLRPVRKMGAVDLYKGRFRLQRVILRGKAVDHLRKTTLSAPARSGEKAVKAVLWIEHGRLGQLDALAQASVIPNKLGKAGLVPRLGLPPGQAVENRPPGTLLHQAFPNQSV